jgi:polysaccharide pyruvyl transferase WcaK-like protein
MRATIGLVGFFGWGNYGDELFLKVWHEHLGPHADLRVVHDLLQAPYFSGPVDDVVDSVDAILIGGGDLIIPWNVSGLYWREEYLRRPVYIAGVGVPTWRRAVPSVVDRMRRFVQHPNVRFISARDPESARWIVRNLEPSTPVTWAPDLVFAMTLPSVERTFTDKVLSVATRYRRGRPADMSQMNRLIERAFDMGWRVNGIVLGTGRTGELDLDVARQFEGLGVKTIYSEDLDELTRAVAESDAVATMKFHGTVVATAYGVPAIPVAATDKTRNLFRMIDRLPMMTSLSDPTLADRLHPYLLPVPRIVRQHLQAKATHGVESVRDAILREFRSQSEEYLGR